MAAKGRIGSSDKTLNLGKSIFHVSFIHKLILILLAPLFLFGCKEEQVNSTVTLYYDFYHNDSVVLKKAIKIEYENVVSREYRKVIIETSEDSVIATFYQKTSDAGIFRSLDTVGFKLSHSFLPKAEVELKLGDPIPYFLNVLATNRNAKTYQYDNKDSAEVIFFDEAIPWDSYTCSL